MANTRNILLIGRTGSGKSSLANVISGTDKFVESARSTSVTKGIEEGMVEIDLNDDGSEKIRYRIIDTIGIGDTKMTPQGVLTKLAEMGGRVKQEGLNQILFVTKGRFSKEEIETYDLLSSIIFDSEVLKFTTIVRVGFPEFEDQEACDEDRWQLREENPKLAHILNSVKVIYLDNPPLKGRNIEANKEIREESRKRLLTYLATCQGNYRPSNIDKLDERVQDYKTDEQKFKIKMKELEDARKEQAEKFRKDMAELREKHDKDAKETREKFERDLRESEEKADKKLEKTVKEADEKREKDMKEQDQKNKEREDKAETRHKEAVKDLKETAEKREKASQEEARQHRSEMEGLKNKLEESSNSANNKMVESLQQQRIDDRVREEKRERERKEDLQRAEVEKQKYEQKRLDIEEKRRKEDEIKEQNRQQREDEKDEKRRQEEAKKEAKFEALQKKLKEEEESKKYQQEQLQKERNRGVWDKIWNG